MTWLGKTSCTSQPSHDIVLLELKEEDELDLTTYTPACLARSEDRESFDNKTATVAGWGLPKKIFFFVILIPIYFLGKTSFFGERPDPLEVHEVDLTVRPVADCPGLFDNGSEMSPSEICAGQDGGGKDACQVRRTLIYNNYH